MAGGFSRWFVEVTGEIKVQPPAHTAVSEVQMLLLVTKAWPCAGGTRAMCSWRGGCHAGDGYSWLFWGSIATLDQTDPGGISLPSSLCHAAVLGSRDLWCVPTVSWSHNHQEPLWAPQHFLAAQLPWSSQDISPQHLCLCCLDSLALALSFPGVTCASVAPGSSGRLTVIDV